jgi:hypothetical protein
MNEHDDIQPEVRAFAADIADLLADDSVELSIRETPGERGSEPAITFCAQGVALFHFRRDEFIEAMYAAGCDAMADLLRAGLPLAVDPSQIPGLIQ